MRFFILLPHDLATALITMARQDCRSPRQEAEWLLRVALEQFLEQECVHASDAQEKSYASAS